MKCNTDLQTFFYPWAEKVKKQLSIGSKLYRARPAFSSSHGMRTLDDTLPMVLLVETFLRSLKEHSKCLVKYAGISARFRPSTEHFFPARLLPFF